MRFIRVTGNIQNRRWHVEKQARSGQSARFEKLHGAWLIAFLARYPNAALVADNFQVFVKVEVTYVR